jgi:hypothetical protein
MKEGVSKESTLFFLLLRRECMVVRRVNPSVPKIPKGYEIVARHASAGTKGRITGIESHRDGTI